MTKGKPWPAQDEATLRERWLGGTRDLDALALLFEGRYTEGAIYEKLRDLGLVRAGKVGEDEAAANSFSSVDLPSELPSVEETLRLLAEAVKALQAPGLSRAEILRLGKVLAGLKIYKDMLADYIDYRAIEAELLSWKAKYEALEKAAQKTQST